MTRISKRFLLGGMSLAALTVTACGGGGSKEQAKSDPAAETATTAAPAPTPTTAAAPPPESTDTIDGTTLASFTGTAAAGETVFIQCKTCHVTDPGVNRIGPSLAGIVGRQAGQVAGFNYTPANKNSGITWSKEKLFQYLERPQRVVPGTKMAFAGISDAQKRADVIAYLEAPTAP